MSYSHLRFTNYAAVCGLLLSSSTLTANSAAPTVHKAPPKDTRKLSATLAATAVSTAPVAPAAPGGTPAPSGSQLPVRGTYQVTGDANSLSVFAVSADAAEVLTAIAERARLPLVVDDTVSRRVTINITNKPVHTIIDDIATAYGLSTADVDGVTMISEGIPRSPSSYLLSDIDSIPTKYVDANNARNLLPVFLQDYVKVNSEQNAVVLSAPAEVLKKFRTDIAQFDTPASEIQVDLLLVELTKSDETSLGLQTLWQNAQRGISVNPSTGSLGYQAITTLTNEFTAALTALEQRGEAKVRANPRIATISGRGASIFVGRQQYVSTPIDSGGGQKNFIDAGVRFNIVPYTGGEKQILVDVNAEVSTLSAPDPLTNLPEKSSRTASTAVRVNDGQTIVIGGLTQQEIRTVHTKIPILGDIPVLGPLLFQTKNDRNVQTELVLFITPRILSDTGHLPDKEERALKQRYLENDFDKPVPPAIPVKDPTDDSAKPSVIGQKPSGSKTP